MERNLDQGHQSDGIDGRAGQLKWMDRPWFAVISAVSLTLNVIMGILSLAAWNRAASIQELSEAALLPRGDIEYIQIADSGISDGIWKESERLRAPWVETGVLDQVKCEGSVCYVDDFFGKRADAVARMIRDKAQLSGAEADSRNLFVLSIKNNGGAALIECKVRVSSLSTEDGGVILMTSVNKFDEGSGINRSMLNDEIISIGNIEKGDGKIIPLFFETYFGGKVDPLRVAMGRVLIPDSVFCKNEQGKNVSLDAKRPLRDAVKYDPYLYVRG